MLESTKNKIIRLSKFYFRRLSRKRFVPLAGCQRRTNTSTIVFGVRSVKRSPMAHDITKFARQNTVTRPILQKLTLWFSKTSSRPLKFLCCCMQSLQIRMAKYSLMGMTKATSKERKLNVARKNSNRQQSVNQKS